MPPHLGGFGETVRAAVWVLRWPAFSVERVFFSISSPSSVSCDLACPRASLAPARPRERAIARVGSGVAHQRLADATTRTACAPFCVGRRRSRPTAPHHNVQPQPQLQPQPQPRPRPRPQRQRHEVLAACEKYTAQFPDQPYWAPCELMQKVVASGLTLEDWWAANGAAYSQKK